MKVEPVQDNRNSKVSFLNFKNDTKHIVVVVRVSRPQALRWEQVPRPQLLRWQQVPRPQSLRWQQVPRPQSLRWQKVPRPQLLRYQQVPRPQSLRWQQVPRPQSLRWQQVPRPQLLRCTHSHHCTGRLVTNNQQHIVDIINKHKGKTMAYILYLYIYNAN